MNIPSLPTDNLYKFISIFGLIIFLFSFFLKESLSEKIHTASVQMELIRNKKRLDSIDYFIADVILKSEYDKHEHAKLNEEGKHDDTHLFNEIEKFIKKYDVYVLSSSDYEKQLRDLKFYQNQQKINRLYGLILLFIGIFCIVFGFSLWYDKHQKYLDAERKYQGEKFINQLNKDKKKKNKKSKSETT